MQNVGGQLTLSSGDLVGHLNCRYLTELDLKVAKGELGAQGWSVAAATVRDLGGRVRWLLADLCGQPSRERPVQRRAGRQDVRFGDGQRQAKGAVRRLSRSSGAVTSPSKAISPSGAGADRRPPDLPE